MATAPHGGPSARLRRQQEVEMYGVPDMVLLSNPITDHSILKNLRTRFERSLIYTGIGSVLLAVNPFRNIKGLYGEEQVRFYHESSHLGRGEAAGGASAAMQQIAGSEARLGGPHIFAVAEEAYRNMLSEEQNQCIIISGESGAGKTEASKQITSFLSSVSGHTAEMQRVKNIILQSNPLIEAFGNAKTVRNDNSSRFGKFFQVYFDRFGGPVGGHMDGFLLEKSRVSSVQDGERNFHVFYQMCAGADEALRDSLQLKSADHYCYLNPARRAAAEKGLGSAGTAQYIPGSLLRSGVDDAADWASTLAAMEAIGMAPSDRTAVLDTLALVLHVGEVQFHESAAAAGGVVGSDPCRIANDAVLQRVAERLGVDGEKLRRALTWRSLRTGQSEVVQVPLDLQQCQNTRDALAKALYASLFDFILAAVNRALTEREPHALMLGVLDIYGFEVFSERNGYEQFCINYVNERLQELFIELTLKVEQEEYVQEGIPWEEVHYFDNREVCRLLDGTNPPGLFQIMDDVCLALSKEEETVVDRKLAERMDLAHHESSFFHRVDRGFSIHHYAGEVCYDTSGFTSRNKDLLSADMLELLTLSTKPFLLELVGPLLVTVGRGSSAAASQRSMTAGQKLRLQAATLIDTLKQCQPHYVRTIKPNDVKRPDLMDDARMLHQIKYLGLQENIRVRRAGYSYRQYLDKFIQRFRFLSPATFPRLLTGSDRQACEAILHAAEVRGVIPPGSWALGRHKVFVRQPDHLFSLEDARADALDRLVERIQRSWRGYRDRRTFICLKDAVDGLFTQHRKARRADSVFRPFDGRHIDLAATSSHPAVPFLQRYMDYDPVGEAWKTSWCSDTGKAYYWNAITLDTTWELPYELEHRSQRVVFCAEVERVGVRSHKDQTELDVHLQVLLITDRALLLVEKCASTPPSATAEKKKPRRENRQPLEQPRWWLRKRIDLRLLAGISVTKQADDVVGLHFYIPNKAARPIHSSSQPPDVAASKKSSGTPTITCEVCGERVRHTSTHCSICPCCGRRCCTHTCLTVRRPLPTLVGHVEPVLVCVRCRYSEPLEPVEDLLLRSPAKTELLALLSCASHARSGRPTAITVADSFSISTASSSSVAAAAAAPRKSRRSKAEEPTHASTSELLWRQWHVQAELDPSLEEHVELRWSDESEAVLVRSPGGLPQATIAAIHAARAVRRQHEAARHHAEAAARKEAEGQREADRERQRQEQVAERRKQRALKAAEAEALNRSREEAAAQRREEAARLVSQRAARIHQ